MDPSSASGFAPSALMIGRQLVYPFELNKIDIDFEGVHLTKPLVHNLRSIHDTQFGIAKRNIQKAQRRYKKQYDNRNNVQEFNLKKDDFVQYKRHVSRRTLSKSKISLWCPHKSYHIIQKINFEKKSVHLQTKEGQILKKSFTFDRIRKLSL